MSKVLAAIVVAFFSWLGSVGPAVACTSAAEDLDPIHLYTYDGNHASASPMQVGTERGSVKATYDYTTNDAVDRFSPGASARSGDPTPPTICGYDDAACVVRGACGSHYIEGPSSGREAGICVDQRLRVAAKTGDDLVDVWRVVGPDEAAQISKTGSYQVQLGGEGKYFFPTREQAENLGQMYTKQGWGGQQTLTRGQAPRSVIDRAEPVNAGTEGPGWFVRSPDIPSVGDA